MSAKYDPAVLAKAARHTLHAFREGDERAKFLVLQLMLRFGTDQPNVIRQLQVLSEAVPETEGAPA